MTRLSELPPVHCAVCHQPSSVSDHADRYVDFEVAYEGPVLTSGGETMANYNPIPVDDLVICEQCLRTGARLIGMEDAVDMREQLVVKDERIHELELENAAKDRVISDQDHSLGVIIDHPVNRPARPPKVVGPDSHADDVKKVRSRRRMAAKVSASQKAKKEKATSGA